MPGRGLPALRWNALCVHGVSPRFPGSPSTSNAVCGWSCLSMGCLGQETIPEVASSLSADVFKLHSLHSAFTVHEGFTSLPLSWG